MKAFFEAYQGAEKLAPLVREIGWAKKPIGVATYDITQTLPKELKGQLPPPEEIAALLEGIWP